ncbi:type I-E CRISPR-associated protein Cse2/CasB [Streptomyces acidiscabies]|uniref:type I-E CRISPR-associated protein Cse2/CasB n=1 Tax=Streptomyces acidiscabies TaxID=42234 RepID=UPI00073E9DEF|nr:type I-E CRISPR-associated protein Cse2/CasB [Streptomyces acidiscabies]GAQ52414.1 CRISPR-associated protein Cse2 (CRISPR_cse2 [Streptomyces acidiscabies]GAV43205.1 CRISPR-associated protein Cse2 (CRISPR_cse2 [Streptomyces acidiscabies]
MNPDPSQSAQLLTRWLTGLVRGRDYGALARLRRPTMEEKPHIQAGNFDVERREVFEQVAFLFAVYHQGAAKPEWGHGSVGTAARRIGTGPEDPGACRLVDRIVASRRPPLRHLRHTIARLRSCEKSPPHWPRLVDDLTCWRDKEARIAYHWALDFHAPTPKKGIN